MPKKKKPVKLPKRLAKIQKLISKPVKVKSARRREDVNQAAARIVREATEHN